MVKKVIPKEIINAVTKNTKKRKNTSEAKIARPTTKELPEKFVEFTKATPTMTAAEEKRQTTVKIDKSFEKVYSRLVGGKPSKRKRVRAAI